MMVKNIGYRLNTKDLSIYATSAVALCTSIEIVRFGLKMKALLNLRDQKFDPWLRAPPFLAFRKKFVSVPGFFVKKLQSKPR